jgi:hypothetical protein
MAALVRVNAAGWLNDARRQLQLVNAEAIAPELQMAGD